MKKCSLSILQSTMHFFTQHQLFRPSDSLLDRHIAHRTPLIPRRLSLPLTPSSTAAQHPAPSSPVMLVPILPPLLAQAAGQSADVPRHYE